MGVSYTSDQLEVINNPIGNLLVSAAAGSGKTAVLSERVVDMVIDEDAQVDIDRVLIVTFAKDAAAEMKSRIADKLRKKSTQDKENKRIKKQMSLIHNANVCTIDSFCNYIVSNHAGEIGIDPNMRIATEDELTILVDDALDDVLEECFSNMSEDFTELVEANAPDGKLDGLKNNIKKIYSAAQAQAFPESWLLDIKAMDFSDETAFLNSKYVEECIKYEDILLKGLITRTRELIEYTNRPGAFSGYETALYDDISLFESMLSCDMKGRFIKVSELKWAPKPKGAAPAGVDPLEFKTNVEYVQKERDKVKRSFAKIAEGYSKTFEDEHRKCVAAKRNIDTYIDVVIGFMHKVAEYKKEKSVMDFNDMEHYALSILVKQDEEGGFVPTKTALDYREYFQEIMIDEYQDSSIIQEVILSSIAKESGNRFMVGDVKQSIYGFRLARPDIFLDKYNGYSMAAGNNRKIVLSMNFRSRGEVLDSVNDVFEKIMRKEIGGIDYDKPQRLYLGADYYPQKGEIDNTTELLYFDDKAEDMPVKSKEEMDALLMAIRIKELVGTFMVTDKKTGDLRPAEYRDIVILLRSTKDQDNIIKKVFENFDIPVYSSSRNGYFDATEIKLILNYISVLGNRRIDIPLYGIMHNEAFGGLSEEEIAIVCKGKSKKYSLIDKVRKFVNDPSSDRDIVNKLTKLLDDIDSFRKKAVYMDTEELIIGICDHYRYFDYLSVLPTGDQRVANVKLLIDVAKDYKNSSYSGFYDFVRYVDDLKAKELDMGEANVFDDQANVVRVMTMHKSKGLEFPIAILGRMDKEFGGRKDGVGIALNSDAELGLGSKYVDLVRRTKDDTALYRGIKNKHIINDIGEEIRVLYVAMTRAKEKLIMVGRANEKSLVAYGSDEAYPEEKIVGAKSYMDLVLPIALENDHFICADYTGSMQGIAIREEVDRIAKRDAIEGIKPVACPEFFVYPHRDLNMLYNKTTVSELKKAALEPEDDGSKRIEYHAPLDKTVPSFMERRVKASSADIGNAYHRVFQIMDYKNILTRPDKDVALAEMKEGWISNSYISKESYDLVDESKILDFLSTDIAERMASADKAGRLFREKPFMMGIDSGSISPEYPSGEIVMIQGVVDVYFVEDDGIVLIDYKTDKVKDASELVERYRVQLDYYKQALERLLHKPVKEKYIYSVALGTIIDIV